MTQVMAGSINYPQICRAVRVRDRSGVEHRHEIIVAAMNHELLPRRQAGRGLAGIDRAQLLRPITKVFWKGTIADRSHFACEHQQLAGTARPVVEIRWQRHRADPTDSFIGSPGLDRQGTTSTKR